MATQQANRKASAYDLPNSPKARPGAKSECHIGRAGSKRIAAAAIRETVSADGRVLIRERVCLHGMPLVGEAYRGFRGELYFVDTAGSLDPQWQELGSRFILVYRDEH